MKRKILITLLCTALVTAILWGSGIIPRGIARIAGEKELQQRFPNLFPTEISVEWNRFYGDYVFSFSDQDGERHSCVIGPRIFPVTLGQGTLALEEYYQETQKN